MKMRLLFGLLALAAPLAPLAAQETPTQAVAGTRLTVTAQGRVTRAPDYVGIVAGVTTEAPTASEAIRQNAARMEAIRAALRRAGIADRDIRTSAISLQPQWREVANEPRVFAGYAAANRLTIRFRDIANAGRVIDTLVTAGANQVEGPDLGIERPESALDEARALAVANARARADLYARSLGMRIKRIVSVGESGMMMPMANFANARQNADASTEIDPGVQALTVDVTMVFELE